MSELSIAISIAKHGQGDWSYRIMFLGEKAEDGKWKLEAELGLHPIMYTREAVKEFYDKLLTSGLNENEEIMNRLKDTEWEFIQ